MTQVHDELRYSPVIGDDAGHIKTIYASFKDGAKAERAAGALLDFGVRAEDISLVARRTEFDADHYTGQSHASEPPTWLNNGVETAHTLSLTPFPPGAHNGMPMDETAVTAKSGISTTTPADAAAGAVKGAGIGLGVGIAAALASLLIPGFGLVAGGGALAIALGGAAGTTAAGAVAGGVTGYMKDQGIPDEAVTVYASDYEAGGAILGVAVPSNDVDEISARRIMSKYGGDNITAFRSHTSGMVLPVAQPARADVPITAPNGFPTNMKLESLQELYEDEIKDLYSAENQIMVALPKMADAATSPELKTGFTTHMEQTKGHVSRLEQICMDMNINPSGKFCKGTEGLLKEAAELLKMGALPDVLDAGLISAAQRVEHYEISGYGTCLAYANQLGHTMAAGLLTKSLNDVKENDQKLTMLAVKHVNGDAVSPTMYAA